MVNNIMMITLEILCIILRTVYYLTSLLYTVSARGDMQYDFITRITRV